MREMNIKKPAGRCVPAIAVTTGPWVKLRRLPVALVAITLLVEVGVSASPAQALRTPKPEGATVPSNVAMAAAGRSGYWPVAVVPVSAQGLADPLSEAGITSKCGRREDVSMVLRLARFSECKLFVERYVTKRITQDDNPAWLTAIFVSACVMLGEPRVIAACAATVGAYAYTGIEAAKEAIVNNQCLVLRVSHLRAPGWPGTPVVSTAPAWGRTGGPDCQGEYDR